jgi:hypothetical protein
MIYLLGDVKVLALAKWLGNHCSQALINIVLYSTGSKESLKLEFLLTMVSSFLSCVLQAEVEDHRRVFRSYNTTSESYLSNRYLDKHRLAYCPTKKMFSLVLPKIVEVFGFATFFVFVQVLQKLK